MSLITNKKHSPDSRTRERMFDRAGMLKDTNMLPKRKSVMKNLTNAPPHISVFTERTSNREINP